MSQGVGVLVRGDGVAVGLSLDECHFGGCFEEVQSRGVD